MDSLILWVIAFTALGGALSAVAAGAFLLLPTAMRARLLAPLVSFAVGALLGAALLGLLPHALSAEHGVAPERITLTVLLGLLLFFVLEKMVIWRHCHADDCEVHGHADNPPSAHDIEHARQVAAGKLILIGDGIHNLVDGVLIAAAFLTDLQLGILTSIAVIAHEIPQEVGDFAILLNSGYSRARAFMFNVLSGLTTVAGGIVAYYSLSFAEQVIPYVLAIAASSFLYIAVADLIPGLHKRPAVSATLQQVLLIGCGIGTIFLAQTLLH